MRRVFRRFAPRPLLLILLPLTLFAARPSAALTVAQITSIPSANQSWGLVGSGSSIEADVFWIRNTVTVTSSFTLTLNPGIIVKFDPGTYLQVNGSIHAVGTGGNLIHITSSRDDTQGGDTNGDGASTQAAPSDWNAIYLASHASPDSSRFVFCDIAYGGYGGNGMITFQTGISGDVLNCTLRRAYSGIAMNGTSAPNIVDTNIQNSTLTPIIMDFNSTPAFNRLTFSQGNNAYDAVGIRSNILNSGTATLTKRTVTVGTTLYNNITYVVLGGETINPTATLVLSPGIVLKMVGGASMVNYGTLTMNGTPTDTVSVTSIHDDTIGQPADTNDNGSSTSPHGGDWSQINFQAGSTGSLQYCQLRFGTTGTSNGMLEAFNVNLPVSNTLLTDAGHGFTFHGTSAPTLTNVVINNMASSPTLMSLTCNPSITNLSFHANTITALGLIGETVTGALHLTQRNIPPYNNITYYIQGGYLDIASGSSLVIDAGIVIKFPVSGGVGIIADGTLTANGTVGAPVVFTGERDNVWGNPADTNGDGGGTSPAPGQWGFIQINSTAGASALNYCRIECGSAAPFDGYPCNLWINGSSPTISHCNVNRGNYGIRVNGAVTPTIGTADTVTNCVTAPILMSAMSDPTFTSPYFANNGQNGLALISETLTQNATIKYRPQVIFPPPAATSVFAYVVNGTITVPLGVTLAIQPQVVIKVQNGPAFSIAGTLNAVGNPGGANRITVTSYRDDTVGGDTNGDTNASSPTSGNWGTAFSFTSTASATSVVRNCLFTFGGSGNSGGPAVMAVGSKPRIVSSDFLFNNSALTFGAGSTSVVDSCSILNCNNLPVNMSLLADPTFTHITWSGNPYSVIGILGESIGQDAHLTTRNLGPGPLSNIAYAPTGTITIGSSAKWTIEPGLTIKLGRYGVDPTGFYIAIDGALAANGTPDSLIIFTSMADDAFSGDSNGDGASSHGNPGDWWGIGFSALTNVAATVMNNVRLRFAGGNGVPAISMTNASVPITNTNVTAGYEGIDILGTSAPLLSAVNVDSCTYFPIRMSLAGNPTFTNVFFKSNSYTGIGVVNETIAQDLLWKIRPISGRNNMPYLVDGNVGAGLATTLTLQPGLIVKLRPGANIIVNRAFFALGKAVPESLIVFTSIRDDFYGGRSDTTSATTAPNAGDWSTVLVQNTAIDGQVHFHDCVFRYGGSGFQGALRCNSSNPAVDSCLFAYNSTGISVEGSANPHIQGSSFLGHVYDAVYNAGNSHCVFAEQCWWGANNGPNDPSATPDVCNASVGPTNLG
ncbi:MAG TPA: hypothetical protein VMJ70_03955, partial [Candidatus Sulfotelmatobacter sp.]|nr:hypothetical protein [Candidatus Sulfotelmatobacter sp.]